MKERLSCLMASVLLLMCIALYQAFNVTDPACQHAIKKLLCMGLRGHKDVITDLDDAIDSLNKMKTYLEQTK